MRASTQAWLLPFLCLCACVGDAPVNVTDSGVTSDSGTPDSAADGGPDAALATLSITPNTPLLRRGSTLDVTVNVDRQSVSGPITLVASGMPSGVTATIGVIAGGATTGTLKLAATAGATPGATKLTLKAAGVADFTFDLLVASAPGTLDESFDNDGIVLDTGTATGKYQAVLAQPDGKVVAVGTTNPTGGAWLVRRYNADGTLDAPFNTAAAAAIPTTGAARAIVLDPTKGRLVIAGTTVQVSADRGTVVRLNADGSADQGFASAGTLLVDTISFGTGNVVNAVSVLSNSSVVVAGVTGNSSVGFVTRYTDKGVSDSNFLDFRTQGKAIFTGVMELTGGALLAVGTDTSVSPPAQLAVRVTPNGNPDGLFGPGGTRTYASGCRGFAGALTSGGDALIVGQEVFGPSYCETRIAATGNGALSWSKVYDGGNAAGVFGAAGAAGDATYAVGYMSGGVDRIAFLNRRKADGNLDTTFGTGGQAQFEDATTPDTYRFSLLATAVAADGRVLVAGQRLGATPGPLLLRIWQ